MAFGIIECHRMEVVPGTALLHDQDGVPTELSGVPAERMKRGKGRFSHILLVPQPTNSPNDPLNWPIWKKDLILLLVGMNAAVVGAYSRMLGPGLVPVAAQFGISVETLSQSTAWLILMLGLCVFVFSPLAKIYGKRPIYVLASGIGTAPYEVLVQVTISDLYFVHERGTRLAVWNLFLLSSIAGAGFISGYINEDLGYHWAIRICAILFGIFGFEILSFVPETTYIRRTTISDELRVRAGDKLKDAEKAMHVEYIEGSSAVTGNGTTPVNSSEDTMPYERSLRLYTGRYTDAALWEIFIRPFIVFFYPCVLWGFLIHGTTLTWIVVFSVVNSVIFVAPPYNFSVGQTGLISLSPFILSITGKVISGPLNDYICLKLSKRDHGIYESEFRLVLMMVVVILGIVGFFGFGATEHFETNWSGPVLTCGFADMSLAFASTCVFGFILDCYPKLAEEAFVAINTRNLLTFGLTYFVNSWLAKDGSLTVFSILGSCFFGVCALTIPLWIFGKKIRSWVAKNDFLNEFIRDI